MEKAGSGLLNLNNFAPDVLYVFAFRNGKVGTGLYHAHDFLEMSIMLAGCADYRIESAHRRIHAGQVMVFNPGVHHQDSQTQGTNSYQLHIGFRGITLPGVAADRMPFADSVVDLGEQREAFFETAGRIAAESQGATLVGRDLLQQARVIELLCLLMRALPNNQVSADHVSAQAAAETPDRSALAVAASYYLEAHYTEPVTLTDLADHLHVSTAHLSHTFKAVNGVGPMGYMTSLRLNRAQQLLKETALPIKAVASAVGYQDPYYFSRLFKQTFGQAPSQVQEQRGSA
ncbi:helix-turn-helix transcriptional regulator [Lacticaseibacillus absianus]|uniref:helix-turn-helix transcriptional regulator n=1 Tax=Lacticaseibacillus absianus TaxID=2729623 RepID=UPI001FEA8DF0|nr:AraC family transcriptional regulator [Lacticaseibacillus absianus]